MGGDARPSLLERISEQMASSDARRAARADSAGGVSLAEAFRRAVAGNWRGFAVLAVVAVVLGVVFRHHVSWGDVPTWVLAATTLLAFAAAAFAGVVAYGLLSIENDREVRAASERAERREAEVRQQASKVAAWYATWPSPPLFGSDAPAPAILPQETHGARIRNASDLPVYDVRISFWVATSSASDAGWRARERHSSPGPILVIPPGVETAEIPDDVRLRETEGGNEPKWLVGIQFTDADGRRWMRAPSGQLRAL